MDTKIMSNNAFIVWIAAIACVYSMLSAPIEIVKKYYIQKPHYPKPCYKETVIQGVVYLQEGNTGILCPKFRRDGRVETR